VEPLPTQVGGSFILIVHRRSLLSLFPDTHSHDALESNAHSMDVTPWAEWGPPVTRWFNADNIPTRWITTTAGQRCVVRADALVEPFPIVILDFNPYNVRRKAREQKDKPTSRAWVVTGRDAFSELGMFEERVDSRLPFFVFESMQHFDFDGVLMDEERILGIRVCNFSRFAGYAFSNFGDECHRRMQAIRLRPLKYCTLDNNFILGHTLPDSSTFSLCFVEN